MCACRRKRHTCAILRVCIRQRLLTHAGGFALETLDLARQAVDAALDKKAADIVLLDIHELSIIADYFIICTGSNPRQINAIGEALDAALSKDGLPLLHREGNPDSGWVLLDFGDIICHVFAPMEREFYQLERLWAAAPRLLYVE